MRGDLPGDVLVVSTNCNRPEARSTTSWGTPGLDLGAGVRAQLAAAGIDDVRTVDACTREDASWPSYRRDGDAATRFAGVIWSHR